MKLDKSTAMCRVSCMLFVPPISWHCIDLRSKTAFIKFKGTVIRILSQKSSKLVDSVVMHSNRPLSLTNNQSLRQNPQVAYISDDTLVSLWFSASDMRR